MPSAQASKRAVRRACALGVLGLPLLTPACGGSSSPEAEPALLSGAYEGPNFYESPGEVTLPAAPEAPGYPDLLGSDEPAPVCSRGVVPDSSTPPPDPALGCPPLERDGLSDFTYTGGNGSVLNFGADSSVPGGIYFYPEGSLSSDVTDGDWHLRGMVDGVSGFGIYLNGCRQLDASAYRGIAFTLWGEIGEGGSLMFFIGTAGNQISHAWLNANKASPSDPDEPANLGRCTPVASRYDGSCREARTTLQVTETLRQHRVQWQSFTQGCPEVTVNPSEITAIAWYFPEAAGGPYPVDIHIDDLRFTDEGPL